MSEPTKRILIVGGVAGGASAATRARRLDERAEIVLFEKDEHVSFANCGLPYYLGGEIGERGKLLVVAPELLERRFRIEVRTRTEVLAIDRAARNVRVRDRRDGSEREERYDVLILAPGAAPVVPPLAGADAPNVFRLRNVADTDAIKAFLEARGPTVATDGPREPRVVVVGAGFIGLEMAEQLAAAGCRPVLVELQEQVLPVLDAELAHMLEEELVRHDVELHLGKGVERLELEGGLVRSVVLADGTALGAEAVLFAIGVRPQTGLASAAGLELGPTGGIAVDELQRTSDPAILAVGDASEYVFGPTGARQRVPLAGPANRAGRVAGEVAATGTCTTPMAPVLGTAIVRVFGLAAACTGLTERAAERAGVAARSVTVLRKHHADYYPGAEQLALKLVYAPEDGRVLGAQAVGAAGVDKRIDVIATALRFGATVRDLAGLDLAYAPPFGAAKDPVHMAAFVACNERDGLTRVSGSAADVSAMQVLDVRSEAEFADGALPGARNVPIEALRGRLGELDPGRTTVVVCAVGLRGWIGARILLQRGFADVRVLAGGMTMRRHAELAQAGPRSFVPARAAGV